MEEESEKTALRARYETAWKAAEADDSAGRLKAFEEEVRNKSVATINVTAAMLLQVLESESALYTAYSRLVDSEVRLPASRQDDRRRSSIEGMLFGSLAPQIRYAALSIGNKGLASYGDCTIVLCDPKLQYSATLLERNSYEFVKEHDLGFDDPIPLGYRAIWADRHMLATAKLAQKVASATPSAMAADILMFGEGNRDTDEFIEIHVWGPFGAQAIESVAVPDPEKVANRAWIILRIRDRMDKLQKRCDFI